MRSMGALRYSLPFGFLALLPLGAWLGGAFVLAPELATPLLLAGLDATLGDAPRPADAVSSLAHRALPWLYVPAQLAALAWTAWLASRPATGFPEAAGLSLSAGFTVGIFGFVVAHE